jgi:hypothetical protein
MGSSELDPGGLSPPPPATTLNSAPFAMSPSTDLMTSSPTAAPNSFATTPQTSAGVACAGLPGNINSTATLTSGSC